MHRKNMDHTLSAKGEKNQNSRQKSVSLLQHHPNIDLYVHEIHCNMNSRIHSMFSKTQKDIFNEKHSEKEKCNQVQLV